MASSKAKAGVLGESGPLKEAKGAGGAPPAGEAAANSRSYSLEELDTVATVGEYRAGLRGPSGPDPHTEREREREVQGVLQAAASTPCHRLQTCGPKPSWTVQVHDQNLESGPLMGFCPT